MGYIKTSGIVIKECIFGDTDKIITLLTKNHGKILCFVKDAKKAKGKFGIGTELLCYSNFLLYKGKDYYQIKSLEIIEAFYELRNNLTNLTYSVHFSDIVYDVTLENQPSNKILQLFLNALYFIDKKNKPPELVARIFELRLLSIIGYSPHIVGCIICDNTNFSDNISFSFEKCSFICAKCISNNKHEKKISIGTAKAIYHIITSNIKNLFNFELSQPILKELNQIIPRYLTERLEKQYNKLLFLKNLY